MVYASKSNVKNSWISRPALIFNRKKAKTTWGGGGKHCRGILPDKPVMKISAIFYIMHYFLQKWTFVHFPLQSVSGDGGRKEGHGTPCAAQEQPKPLKFCYFIRVPAKLLMSNS